MAPGADFTTRNESDRQMPRYTINCDTIMLDLATRALKYAENDMPHDTAIVCYGERPNTVDFFVRRTKAGFSATQITTTD